MSTVARLGRQKLGEQTGQALAMVLILLAFGGLTIAVSLNYATTSLEGRGIIAEKVKGAYAAGAGVEYAIWYLRQYGSVPAQLSLPEDINGMSVPVATDNLGIRTLVVNGWYTMGPSQNHYDYVTIAKTITWNATAQAYAYTITLTWQVESGSPDVFIEGLGARVPAGFSYKSSPAPSGMSTQAPAQSGDNSTGYILQWSWSGSSRPVLEEDPGVLTQTFYITGSGSTEGSYVWVKTDRSDIGTVGEITGTLFKITGTAKRPSDNRTVAQVVADNLMMIGGTTFINSWQITQ